MLIVILIFSASRAIVSLHIFVCNVARDECPEKADKWDVEVEQTLEEKQSNSEDTEVSTMASSGGEEPLAQSTVLTSTWLPAQQVLETAV